MAHPLGEERAQRAVDQAAGEDGVLAGTAFAAVPAAGDVTHGVELLLIIDAEREEIDAGTGRLGDGGVDQHGGVAVADEGGAAGLLGVLAEFQRQRAAAQLNGIFLVHGVPPYGLLDLCSFLLKTMRTRAARNGTWHEDEKRAVSMPSFTAARPRSRRTSGAHTNTAARDEKSPSDGVVIWHRGRREERKSYLRRPSLVIRLR